MLKPVFFKNSAILIFLLFIISGLAGSLVAGENSEHVNYDHKDCSVDPMQAGCVYGGPGFILSFTEDGVVYGGGLTVGVFVAPRLSAGVDSSVTWYPDYRLTTAGGHMGYYLGPFGSMYIAPGAAAYRLFVDGEINLTGIAYGPQVALMNRVGRNLLFGFVLYQRTYEYGDTTFIDSGIAPQLSFIF